HFSRCLPTSTVAAVFSSRTSSTDSSAISSLIGGLLLLLLKDCPLGCPDLNFPLYLYFPPRCSA
ncbi:hypothetical protein AVEN_58950-1, partial [Araneus ventricosus]